MTGFPCTLVLEILNPPLAIRKTSPRYKKKRNRRKEEAGEVREGRRKQRREEKREKS